MANNIPTPTADPEQPVKLAHNCVVCLKWYRPYKHGAPNALVAAWLKGRETVLCPSCALSMWLGEIDAAVIGQDRVL